MRLNVPNTNAGQSSEFGGAPAPRGHLPPECCLAKAVHQRSPVCTQAHHCVCAQFFAPPLFVRANCTSRAAKTSHGRIVHNQREGGEVCLQQPSSTAAKPLSNRFEGPDISPCHPPFCSVTKRNLDSRSAHRFLRNSRVLMPDNSGALWLSPTPSARQFIHMSF